jgi:ubiquinone/menaquinone biosynthesis C-methylase UbiE
MSSSKPYWQNHWAGLDDAGHRYNTPEWLQFYAQELLRYLPDKPVRALELGCGNGDLYSFLNQHFSFYTGVDFSSAMLAKFKARWPDLCLICGNGSWLPLEEQSYEVVFSNGVYQYFDQEMIKQNLSQVYRLLSPGGIYLIGNIPDAQLRWLHYVGALRGDQNISWLRLARYLVAILTKQEGDGIGLWYSRWTISQLAVEYGFTCQTFSSSGYEYRFHAVLKKGVSGN